MDVTPLPLVPRLEPGNERKTRQSLEDRHSQAGAWEREAKDRRIVHRLHRWTQIVRIRK
jgi:hypothetical protein